MTPREPAAPESTSAMLQTPRLALRRMTASDAVLYRAIYTDPALMRHVGRALSPGEAEKSFAGALTECRGVATATSWWTASVVPAATPVGLIGLRHAGGDAEVGAMLLPAWQARGLAAEAIACLLAAAFRRDDLQRVLIRHDRALGQGAGVALALGFAPSSAMATDGRQCWELRRETHLARVAGEGGLAATAAVG